MALEPSFNLKPISSNTIARSPTASPLMDIATFQDEVTYSDVLTMDGTQQSAIFYVDYSDWTSSDQKMKNTIQSSQDGGETWFDEMTDAYDDVPQVDRLFCSITDNLQEFPDGTLMRLKCEVTGQLSFSISGECA